MADEGISDHKHYAETGHVEGLGTCESPFKSGIAGGAIPRGTLKDSQRCINRRGDEADHGYDKD